MAFLIHMKVLFEKNTLFLGIIVFFACVAILFYFTNERQIKDGQTMQSILPSPSTSQEPPKVVPQHNSVNVIEDNGNHSTVHYEHGLFTPHEVTIKNETGCFIAIQNADNTTIIPRLGPYDAKKEQGFLYPPILPHKDSLIDPRYGKSSQFLFYNRNNPHADFIVHIDPTCL